MKTPPELAKGWKCGANRSADPPQDCDWPYCGCDPHTDRVIKGLQECGVFIIHPSNVQEDLMCQHEWGHDEFATGTPPHQCHLMEGHKGLHICRYVTCGATAPNDEKAI